MGAAFCRLSYRVYSGSDRILLSGKDFIKRIIPVGISSSWDIGLSNWSFHFITISLYTMSKSTAIIFILFFSILLGLTRKHWSQIVIVFLIFIGLFLFTIEPVDNFSIAGFILVMSASFLSGIRWTFSQLIMQRKECGLGNPIDMMFHVQPVMFIALVPLAFGIEGQRFFHSKLFNPVTRQDSLYILAGIGVGAFVAFFLELSEFLLVSQTSGLTLSIAGIFKEICTLALAIFVNHNSVTTLKIFGMIICLTGIIVHVILKTKEIEPEASDVTELLPKRTTVDAIPLLSPDDLDDEEVVTFTRVKHNDENQATSKKANYIETTDNIILNDNRSWPYKPIVISDDEEEIEEYHKAEVHHNNSFT